MNKNIIETSASMRAGVDKDLNFKVYQDEKPFLEQAKWERENLSSKDRGYKKACTIPDIVAVDLLYKHGIDVHSQEFMNDSSQVQKVIRIMKSEYPQLMSY